jgi:ubiquinone/menaquinone biosynthesis C-methylase UbiE
MACFDRYAGAYHFFYSSFGASRRIYEIITRHSQRLANVLDVGGGTGLVAQRFPSSSRVVVLDPSAKMLDKVDKTLTRCLGKADKIPFEEKHFDLVYSIDAVHHFTNDCPKDDNLVIKTSIKEMLRVMKDDGRLVIIEIDPSFFSGKVIRFYENKVMGWHSTFLNPAELKDFLPKGYAMTYEQEKYYYIAEITKKYKADTSNKKR